MAKVFSFFFFPPSNTVCAQETAGRGRLWFRELGARVGVFGFWLGSLVLKWRCLQGSGRRLKGLGVGCPRGRARTKCDLPDFQVGVFNYEGKPGSS